MIGCSKPEHLSNGNITNGKLALLVTGISAAHNEFREIYTILLFPPPKLNVQTHALNQDVQKKNQNMSEILN